MQLSSITRSLYTSAASLASNAKLGGSYLLSGVKFTTSYASTTAHKAADLSLRALSGASYYTMQSAKAIQSSSQIVFSSVKTGTAAAASNAKLATSYLASKAVAGGSHLVSGAKFTASYTSALAHKATNISLRVLSSASYYATQSANAVKSHPKIALFTVGTGTAAAVLHIAYRHFKATPVATAATRDLPTAFTSKDAKKVKEFLQAATKVEIREAKAKLGNTAANYKLANYIQTNRPVAVAV